MNATTLFPDEELHIEPDANRTEPTIWIRRLVVVAERVPEAVPIREISFRLGLNIVRVADRPSGEARPIGHSVGKTLLTRLIRYCLGESHFAVPAVIGRIAELLPNAYVLAEFNVAGEPWVVARPLRDAPATQSSAVRAADWHAGLDNYTDLQRHGDFLEAVSQATIAQMPELYLASVERSGRWHDLLAWLARDQDCGYRHYHEWREPEAHSGTARLHRDDASLLMRWAMGLLDPAEMQLRDAHDRILNERANAQREAERLTASLENTLPALHRRLDLAGEQMPQGFFAASGRAHANDKIQSLERLLSEFRDESQLNRLHEEAVLAAQAVGEVESDLRHVRGLRQVAEGELQQRRESSVQDYYARFEPLRTCPLGLPECPFNPANRLEGTPDPERETRIAQLAADVARYDEQLGELEAFVAGARRQHTEAEQRFLNERRASERNITGTLTQIGRWQLLLEEIDECEAIRRSVERTQDRLSRLEREIRESLTQQEAVRIEQASRHQRLSRHFNWTLKWLVGPFAGGAVRLDARGLHPAPDVSVAANGAALATLATVLGTDLACTISSVCGLGQHPRFLIHDSPKERDLEPILYARIFTLALELERVFGECQPSFQYILTTTTPPPSELSMDPYVRLTLDGREDEGLFLKARF